MGELQMPTYPSPFHYCHYHYYFIIFILITNCHSSSSTNNLFVHSKKISSSSSSLSFVTTKHNNKNNILFKTAGTSTVARKRYRTPTLLSILSLYKKKPHRPYLHNNKHYCKIDSNDFGTGSDKKEHKVKTAANNKHISSTRIDGSDSSSSSSISMNGNDDNNDSTTAAAVVTICMNHAGASPSTELVTDRIIQHILLEQQIGGYAAANSRTIKNELSDVYKNLGTLLRTDNKNHDVNEIALVESATVAWTKLFYTMIQYQNNNQEQEQPRQENKVIDSKKPVASSENSNRKRKVILISEVEYAANVVAACQWAKDHHVDNDWTVHCLPSTTDNNKKSTGVVDTNVLRDMLEGKMIHKAGTNIDPLDIAMVCITHIPTNCGVINPIEEIGTIISEYNNKKDIMSSLSPSSTTIMPPQILYLVDATQSVGQIDVNVQNIQCHGLVGTSRKYLRGPRGVGFLYISNGIVDYLMPNHIDHAGVPILSVPNKESLLQLSKSATTMTSSSSVTTTPGSINHSSNDSDGDGQDIIGTKIIKGVENVLNYSPQIGAKRFEFWESNIANKLGFGVAIKHILNTRRDYYDYNIDNNCNKGSSHSSSDDDGDSKECNTVTNEIIQSLSQYFINQLLLIEKDYNYGIHIHHYHPDCSHYRSGIIALWFENIDSLQVKNLLWSPSLIPRKDLSNDDNAIPSSFMPLSPLDSSKEEAITTRSKRSNHDNNNNYDKNNNNNDSDDNIHVRFETSFVPATSTPIDSSITSVPDLVRISLSYTNTENEIDLFCNQLITLLKSHQSINQIQK